MYVECLTGCLAHSKISKGLLILLFLLLLFFIIIIKRRLRILNEGRHFQCSEDQNKKKTKPDDIKIHLISSLYFKLQIVYYFCLNRKHQSMLSVLSESWYLFFLWFKRMMVQRSCINGLFEEVSNLKLCAALKRGPKDSFIRDLSTYLCRQISRT